MRLNKEPIATRLGKLAAEARTGILDVTGDTRGTIHIHGGRVVYAESARTPGLTARLAGWAPGQNLPGSLERASAEVAALVSALGSGTDRATAELRNLGDVAKALLEAATAREETRGSQVRSDFPETSEKFRCRLSHGRRPGGRADDLSRARPAVTGA